MHCAVLRAATAPNPPAPVRVTFPTFGFTSRGIRGQGVVGQTNFLRVWGHGLAFSSTSRSFLSPIHHGGYSDILHTDRTRSNHWQ